MLKKLINKLFNYNQPIIDSINWKVPYENSFLQWMKRETIWFGSDLTYRKILWFFLIGFICGIPLLLALSTMNISYIALVILLLFIIITPVAIISYYGILEKKLYLYSINKTSIESVSWKEELLIGKLLGKLSISIILFLLLIIFFIRPSALLVGFGGIVAVGAIAGAKLFSKDYIEANLQYQHLLTTWEKVTTIEINELLQTLYIWGYNLNDKEETRSLFYLFYTPKNKQQLFQLVKEKAKQYNLEIYYTNG